MPSIPRLESPDSTLALLREGYTFISSRCARLGSDVFETRLMLRRVICAMGAEAAEVFYAPDRFTRQGALPPTALLLLQDRGSVQLLDGEAHRHRKRMLMSLMMPVALDALADRFTDQWRAHLAQWAARDAVVLHDEVQAVLCRAVCDWAGGPLTEPEAGRRTREFAAMIAGAGAVGPRNWWGLLLRSRTERWARGIVRAVRAGELEVPEGSAVHAVAWHRKPDGELLQPKYAAVELLNVLRPTVAVARFITFAALALHEHPTAASDLDPNDDDALEAFVHEVRRHYPFFPAIGGRVREPFEWRGRRFDEGTWVLLDLYGTDHDARIWNEPDAFRPERFRRWSGSAFDFIPQGGGDHFAGHRCAGEWITIHLMKRAVQLLTTEMRYEVPEQDLQIDLGRMPALPESGFVITGVRHAS